MPQPRCHLIGKKTEKRTSGESAHFRGQLWDFRYETAGTYTRATSYDTSAMMSVVIGREFVFRNRSWNLIIKLASLHFGRFWIPSPGSIWLFIQIAECILICLLTSLKPDLNERLSFPQWRDRHCPTSSEPLAMPLVLPLRLYKHFKCWQILVMKCLCSEFVV